MDVLPKELEDLIYRYKTAFEAYEERIHEALNVYLNIQGTATYIQREIAEKPALRITSQTIDFLLSLTQDLINDILDNYVTTDKLQQLLMYQDSMESSLVRSVVYSSLEPLHYFEYHPTYPSEEHPTSTSVWGLQLFEVGLYAPPVGGAEHPNIVPF